MKQFVPQDPAKMGPTVNVPRLMRMNSPVPNGPLNCTFRRGELSLVVPPLGIALLGGMAPVNVVLGITVLRALGRVAVCVGPMVSIVTTTLPLVAL